MAKGKNGKGTGKASVIDIPVEFGGVSIGKATLRLGLSIDRSKISLTQADKAFCGHRLSGKVLLGGSNDASGQGQLFDEDEYDGAVSGTFDVKKISVSEAQISTGLTFSLSDIDVSKIAKFSKGSGRLLVDDVQEIPHDAPDEEHDEDDEPKHEPGSLKFECDPEMVGLAKIFKGNKKIIKAFADAGIETVKDMGEYTATGKKIADIKGMGPGFGKIVEDTMVNFYSDNKK